MYTLWWYQCPIASAAPRLDLEFVEAIKAYESIDLKLAQAALKVFKRHTWYLHGEMIPLALWDKHLHDNVKAAIAQKILEQPTDADDPSSKTFVGRHGTDFGKPDLLAVNVDVDSLNQLVTPASLWFFSILGIERDFLSLTPEMWLSSESWKKGKEIVSGLRVTNESAERGVKLVADNLKLAKNEDTFQNYLQVVEHERKENPNLRKISKK